MKSSIVFLHIKPSSLVSALWLTGLTLFIVAQPFERACAFQEADTAPLRWKFAAGDQMTVQFDQAQTVVTRIDARDRTLENELKLVVDWKVMDVAKNGDATVEQTIKRIRIKTGAPGATLRKIVDIDTATDSQLRGVSRDAMKQVKNLIGLKFILVLSERGELVDLKADDGVTAAMAKLPETSALRDSFSVDSLKKIVEQSSMTMAEKSVGKGDSWNDESEITMTSSDGRNYFYDRSTIAEVKSISGDKANIGVKISLTQKGPKPTGTAITSPMELVSYTGNGGMVFDAQQGSVITSTISSELKTRKMYRQDQINTAVSTTNKMIVTRK